MREIYLRAIIIKKSGTDEFTQGHNLLNLFNNLDAPERISLQTEFAKKYPEKTLIDFLKENKEVIG